MYIYILYLNNNKWYIGITENFHNRIYNHFRGKGCKWTKINKVLYVFCYYKIDKSISKKYEKWLTKRFEMLYSHENVRGGGHCIVNSKTCYRENW